MNAYTRAQWEVAEALADESLSFALWMLGSGLCAGKADFARHFGPEFPAAERIGELLSRGFLVVQGNGVTLTAQGEAVLAALGHPGPQSATATAVREDPAADTLHRRGMEPTWEDQLILQVLRSRWPDEIALVGRRAVMGIVQGRTSVDATTGARADFRKLFRVLAAASALLRAALEVIEQLRQTHDRLPTVDEVEYALREYTDIAGDAAAPPVRALLEDLLQHVDPAGT